MNNSISEKTYSLLKKGMDACTFRSKVISNNISNINTKGYKRFDVVFEETLKASSQANMKTSNEKHIRSRGNNGDIKLVRDESSSMRKDGNNVNVDNEMINLAANSMKYYALVSEMNSRFSMTRNVIKGGK
jgi:flagellar basal-body rod protein FlgB